MDELTRDEIDLFLDEQTVGRAGCHAAGVTYVVPLIYVRGGDALYVLTSEGQKIDMLRANPSVCFEVDEYDRATGAWRSVIVQGRYEELDEVGKAEALSLLSARYGGRRRESSRSERAAAKEPGAPATVAFRVVIQSVSGRAVRGRRSASDGEQG